MNFHSLPFLTLLHIFALTHNYVSLVFVTIVMTIKLHCFVVHGYLSMFELKYRFRWLEYWLYSVWWLELYYGLQVYRFTTVCISKPSPRLLPSKWLHRNYKRTTLRVRTKEFFFQCLSPPPFGSKTFHLASRRSRALLAFVSFSRHVSMQLEDSTGLFSSLKTMGFCALLSGCSRSDVYRE